jgi:ribosomal protein L37E
MPMGRCQLVSYNTRRRTCGQGGDGITRSMRRQNRSRLTGGGVAVARKRQALTSLVQMGCAS